MDGGSLFDGGTEDASDSAVPGDAGPPPPAAVVFLHASPSLPTLRLCFLPQDPTWPPFPSDNRMPASNYAGIAVGGAVWLADAGYAAGGGVVYAVRAKPIAGTTTRCDELICTGGSNCLMQNADYWSLGTLSAGDFRPGATTLVAVSGCLGVDDPLASVDRCGSTWDAATGNLHLDVVTVDGAGSNDAGAWSVQAAQLSPGLQAMQGDAGATAVWFGPNVGAPGSEGDAQAVAQLAREGALGPAAPVPLVLPGGSAGLGELGFAVSVTGLDAGSPGQLWMSLTEALELVDPSQDPTTYYAGGPFVVAVLGEPGAPHAFAADTDGGGYDGTGLHVLVLPVGRTP